MRRHHGYIHTICRRLAGNDVDAADATQEALIAIVRGLGHFDGRARFTTWAYRVAANAAIDELRRRGRRPEPVEDAVLTERASGDRPIDAAVAERLEVDEALARIPEVYREAVVLRDLAGLDYAEIAATLQLAPGTVRSRIARGRAALADQLGNPEAPTERRRT